MKNKIVNIGILIATMGILLTACKKSDFDNNYYNPEKSVNATVEGLFGGLFDNPRVLPRYWNLYTFHIPMLGLYSQTIGYTNGNRIYEQAVNYTQDRWNDYYTGTIARYRELEKAYGKFTEEPQKSQYLLFVEIARIFVYDQTAQMVDMWGDVPFTHAGQLNASGGSIILSDYDNAQQLYYFLMDDLKRISDYLSTANPDAFYKNQLTKYDYVNGGSIDMWRKYANALRLRLAMRISYSDENKAKGIAMEILNDPTKYPLPANSDETIQIKANPPSLNSLDIRSGFGVGNLAPGYMLNNVMRPSGDPRLPVYFTTNKNGEYQGVPNDWSATRQADSTTANFFSRVDSVTFSENDRFPGIILTSSEAYFCKAEAFERWGGGDAKAAYEQGIRQSINYYYYLNHLNTRYGTQDPVPDALTITTFLNDPAIAYMGTMDQKLQKIATQKWVDFSIMQANQAWAEWRRTKMPALNFPTDNSSTLSPNAPKRLLYPSQERILNADNYAAVAAKDKVTEKVFWDVK